MPQDSSESSRSAGRTILLGTLAIGIIDILWAIGMTLLEGRDPVRPLQAIAGGLLGPAAFQGGSGTAALGLLLHFCIAFVIMTTYYLASRRFPALARRPWLYGPIYGILVFVVMYQVVLPLSALHTKGIPMGSQLAKGLFIHIFGVGMVAALVSKTDGRMVGRQHNPSPFMKRGRG